MKKPLLAFLLLMSFASALLLAQASSNPPGPPTAAMRVKHRVQFLTTMLSLTATQQQQATTIFTNAATAEDAVHQSMRTAHQDLNTAVKANDAAAIDQAASAIASLMAQMISTQAKANAAFRQALNPDQQAKLEQLDSHGGHAFATGGGPFFFEMGVSPPHP